MHCSIVECSIDGANNDPESKLCIMHNDGIKAFPHKYDNGYAILFYLK